MRFTMNTSGSSSSRYRMRALDIEPRRECRICEALQECDELAPFRPRQGEWAKGRLMLLVAGRFFAQPCLLIMSQNGSERRETSVVHIRPRQRYVPQRRHARGLR